MEESGRLSRHFWLTQGMARTVGVNLNQALRTGQVGRDDYAQLIAECCNCTHCKECMAWLAAHGGGAEQAPDYCAMGRILSKLRD